MRRDWDIIRNLLKATEEDRLIEFLNLKDEEVDRASTEAEREKLEKISSNYYGHLELLVDDDAIRGITVDCSNLGNWSYGAGRPRLSTSGFDLLDALQSKTVWTRVKDYAKENTLPITGALVREVLLRAIQSQI